MFGKATEIVHRKVTKTVRRTAADGTVTEETTVTEEAGTPPADTGLAGRTDKFFSTMQKAFDELFGKG